MPGELRTWVVQRVRAVPGWECGGRGWHAWGPLEREAESRFRVRDKERGQTWDKVPQEGL